MTIKRPPLQCSHGRRAIWAGHLSWLPLILTTHTRLKVPLPTWDELGLGSKLIPWSPHLQKGQVRGGIFELEVTESPSPSCCQGLVSAKASCILYGVLKPLAFSCAIGTDLVLMVSWRTTGGQMRHCVWPTKSKWGPTADTLWSCPTDNKSPANHLSHTCFEALQIQNVSSLGPKSSHCFLSHWVIPSLRPGSPLHLPGTCTSQKTDRNQNTNLPYPTSAPAILQQLQMKANRKRIWKGVKMTHWGKPEFMWTLSSGSRKHTGTPCPKR